MAWSSWLTQLKRLDIREVMGLQYHVTKGKDANNYNPGAKANVEVFMCSVKARAGYSDGFQWLSALLKWTKINVHNDALN